MLPSPRDHTPRSSNSSSPEPFATTKVERDDGRIELTEQDVYDKLGFSWPWYKRWGILSVIFAVQVSMNLNASLYANAVPLLSEEFNLSEQAARVGQAIFLICYAFGCELWAPWSEEFGRWPILQLSLFLVNSESSIVHLYLGYSGSSITFSTVWQIPCALAPNFGTIVVARALGGLSSAGGSVTLGMVADMWEPEIQQYAVAFIVLSSVGGSAVGPIFGGFVQENLSWHWNVRNDHFAFDCK